MYRKYTVWAEHLQSHYMAVINTKVRMAKDEENTGRKRQSAAPGL